MARVTLNPTFEGAVGQFNGYVVGEGRSGLVLRRKPSYRRPTSPAQRWAAQRMRLASAAWSGLSPAQAQAWRDYGEAIVRHRRLDGQPYRMTGQTAFMALATKLLQVDPSREIPLAPPTGVFLGDDLLVSASAGPQLQLPIFEAAARAAEAPSPVHGGGGRERGPALPPPALSTPDPGYPSQETAAVVFTATGPNSGGTVTELMLQRLASRLRKPGKRYTTAAFVSFQPGALQYAAPVEPGVYACAYRFVEPATGRVTLPLTIEVVEVGP